MFHRPGGNSLTSISNGTWPTLCHSYCIIKSSSMFLAHPLHKCESYTTGRMCVNACMCVRGLEGSVLSVCLWMEGWTTQAKTFRGPSSPTSDPCDQNPFQSWGSRTEAEVSDRLFFEKQWHVPQIYIYRAQSCCPGHREERLLGTQISSFKKSTWRNTNSIWPQMFLFPFLHSDWEIPRGPGSQGTVRLLMFKR